MPHTFLRRTFEFNMILERIYKNMCTPLCDLTVEAFHSREPLPFADRKKGKPIKIRKNHLWGKTYDCAWFHFTGQVPPKGAGKKISLRIDLGGEGCVFDNQGKPILGLTSIADQNEQRHFFAKRLVPVTKRARGGEEIDLWVDGANNDLWVFENEPPHLFRMAEIVVENTEMEQLYYDYEMLLRLAEQLPEESPRRHQILFNLHQASLKLDNYTEAEAKAARKVLAKELKKRNGDAPLSASAVGHAHLDLAWLWPIRETLRKAARTFSTAVATMDRYPHYTFGQSQPQIYAWMAEHYPDLFRRIKAKVKSGQWELQGGMWVEADTNTPSGESLVRQILYGKRYFEQEFGFESTMLWLPDVFGYSGALPQILRKCDIHYFMTQKLSWSLFNDFPHHTFNWRGIDGTKILTHMLPSNTYNNSLLPEQVLLGVKNYKDKAITDSFLICHGIGDGGGGPGVEMCERLKRLENLESMPPIKSEHAIDYFHRIDNPETPYAEWSGELYLERHRGTYTTHGKVKRNNRLMEEGLRRVEWLASLAGHLAGTAYPRQQLDRLWKETLLYQFHDILPGSSIKRVYDECNARYEEMLQEVEELSQAMMQAILGQKSSKGKGLAVFNPVNWEREGWLCHENKWLRVTVPAMGYLCTDASAEAEMPALTASKTKLENEKLRVRFNKAGYILSIYDKINQKEVLQEGELGNQLLVYDDQRIGPAGDAWDMRETYADQEPTWCEMVSCEAKVEGPRAILLQKRKYGKSIIQQKIILEAESGRLDFHTEVDWQERGRMLRTRFPVSVRSENLDCGIQYGVVSRPTHRNTSWDQARFEVAACGWADLSQRDYGVALLSDCKYGYCPLPDTLDLHLLRGPNFPDPQADIGKHLFTYSLYPHKGDHGEGQVMRESAELKNPLHVFPGIGGRKQPVEAEAFSFISTEGTGSDTVFVEAVKQAEDDGALVIRLSENGGGAASISIRFASALKRVERVNMLERKVSALRHGKSHVRLSLKPYEVETIKVSFA